MKKNFSLACVAGFLLVCLAPCALAYELSADTVTKEDGEIQKGKIYIKGDKYRIEREGDADYIIIRHDKGVLWVVAPQEKIYVSLPLDPNKTPKIQERNSGEVSRTLLGTETIDGHQTKKYRITVKEGTKRETFYQWTATDINFPIRTAALDDSWSVDFRNIGNTLKDSLFEIPEGFKQARIVITPEEKPKDSNT